MQNTVRWIVALGSILFFLVVSSYVLPEFFCILLSGIVLVALVILLGRSLIAGLLKWRKSSKLWPMPTAICVAIALCTYYLASPTGRYISDRMFERHLADYGRVVADFRDGSVHCATSCNGELGAIETARLPARVRAIWGMHCDGSGVILLFLVYTDVPLLHEGYIFKDSGENSDCSKEFASRESVRYSMRQIEGHWYRFSDQPGF
jgi:hypothetical protein